LVYHIFRYSKGITVTHFSYFKHVRSVCVREREREKESERVRHADKESKKERTESVFTNLIFSREFLKGFDGYLEEDFMKNARCQLFKHLTSSFFVLADGSVLDER
jgi:hypothetical protein